MRKEDFNIGMKVVQEGSYCDYEYTVDMIQNKYVVLKDDIDQEYCVFEEEVWDQLNPVVESKGNDFKVGDLVYDGTSSEPEKVVYVEGDVVVTILLGGDGEYDATDMYIGSDIDRLTKVEDTKTLIKETVDTGSVGVSSIHGVTVNCINNRATPVEVTISG